MILPPIYANGGKRALDLVLALAGCVALSPALFGVWLLLVFEGGQGPFFCQVRCGRGGREFRIFKFRTMIAQPYGGVEITAGDDARITRVGALLRRWKLDELPQLFNVIRGEMALVGPRPEVPKFMARYDEADRRIILSVRPGITDFASILFRNENEMLAGEADVERVYVDRVMPVKARYYRLYVDRLSLVTDFKILFATVWAILMPKPPSWLQQDLSVS